MTVPRNLIGGVLTILVGVGYLWMAASIRASGLDDAVGPAGFPKALAYAVIALGVILCAQSVAAMALRGSRAAAGGSVAAEAGLRRDEAASAAQAEGGGESVRGILRAGGMLLLGIVYLLIVRRLGYLPSVALLMIAAAVYLGTPLSLRVVVIGIAGAIVYWLVFVLLLGIPLPAGVLGGLF